MILFKHPVFLSLKLDYHEVSGFSLTSAGGASMGCAAEIVQFSSCMAAREEERIASVLPVPLSSFRHEDASELVPSASARSGKVQQQQMAPVMRFETYFQDSIGG